MHSCSLYAIVAQHCFDAVGLAAGRQLACNKAASAIQRGFVLET